MAQKRKRARRKPTQWEAFVTNLKGAKMAITSIALVAGSITATVAFYDILPAWIKPASHEHVAQAVAEPLELAKVTRADQLREAVARNEDRLDKLKRRKNRDKDRERRIQRTIKKQLHQLCKLDPTECVN